MHARNHITPDSALGGWQMKRSLRWEGTTGGSGSYLYRTGSSPTGGGKYSYSSWIKRVDLSGQTCLWGAGGGSQTNTHAEGIYITGDDQVALIYRGAVGSGSVGWYAYSTAKLRDTTSWIHLMLTYDNNQSGIANKIKYYFNGVEISYGGGVGSPGDLEYVNKSGVTQYIGRMDQGSGPGYARVYQAETHVADGYIWTPSDFGYTDAHTGKWRPKRPEDISVDYGNNGFYLDYADNTSTSTIGIDRSGNSNNWTASGFSVSAGVDNDSMIDTPTNNFPIMSFINRGVDNPTVSDGGLYFGGSTDHVNVATIAIPSSGKWYWEYTKTANTNLMSGIIGDPEKTYNGTSTFLGGQANGYSVYAANGQTYAAGSNATYMATPSTSTTIMIAFDADTRRLYFGADGNWGDGSGNTNQTFANAAIAHTVTAGITYYPAGSFNGGSAYANFGQRAFSYTPPTGYRSLSSKNRATPLAAGVVNPKRHFAVINYSGNASTNKITGLEFKPDCVWSKVTNATGQYSIFDSVRGATKRMGNGASGFGQGAETTVADSLQSFDENGFTFGNEAGNNNGENYTAWCWKGGGTAVSNSDGTITSSVSVNKDAGFSITTYTGNATSGATVGHGLGTVPQMVILKRRDSGGSNWYVYHHKVNSGSSPEDYYLELNSTATQTSSTKMTNGTPPTSTVFSLSNDNDVNASSGTYVMYSWAEIPGYSKFGSYTGNGDNDGTFVHLGFKPAFVIIKRIASESWIFADIKRTTNELQPIDYYLLSTSNAAQSTGIIYDFLSNGIKFRSTSQNEGNATYIYMAWAEEPSGTGFGLDSNCR